MVASVRMGKHLECTWLLGMTVTVHMPAYTLQAWIACDHRKDLN